MSSIWARWSRLESQIAELEDKQKQIVIEYIDTHRNEFLTLHVTWSFRPQDPKSWPNLILARVWQDIGYTDGKFFRITGHAPMEIPHVVMLDEWETRVLFRNTDFVSEVILPQGKLPLDL